ncbi:hypothetical protein T09_3823 [Trichinella sp. T9]|nr:hypothetical protein T09_3823 [Trichinella sp. T9]
MKLIGVIGFLVITNRSIHEVKRTSQKFAHKSFALRILPELDTDFAPLIRLGS